MWQIIIMGLQKRWQGSRMVHPTNCLTVSYLTVPGFKYRTNQHTKIDDIVQIKKGHHPTNCQTGVDLTDTRSTGSHPLGRLNPVEKRSRQVWWKQDHLKKRCKKVRRNCRTSKEAPAGKVQGSRWTNRRTRDGDSRLFRATEIRKDLIKKIHSPPPPLLLLKKFGDVIEKFSPVGGRSRWEEGRSVFLKLCP